MTGRVMRLILRVICFVLIVHSPAMFQATECREYCRSQTISHLIVPIVDYGCDPVF